MAVRSKDAHWKRREIPPRHWHAVARQAGLNDADRILHELARQAHG
jgi:hypothetical protein